MGLGVGDRAERAEGRLVGLLGRREVVAVVHTKRALLAGCETNRDHHVEPESGEVDEIVAAQGLVSKVGVDQTKPAEAPRTGTQATDVRKHELRGIADDHVVDAASSVDEDSDLTPGCMRHADERTGELRCRQALQRNPPAIDSLKGLGLRRA